MTKQFQIGIVGGGMIAQAHMKNFAGDSRAKLTWIAEINPDARAASAKTFDIANTTADYREMLKDPALDAVVVCTPPISHREIGIAVLQAGKHLLMEKPLTLTMEDAHALQAEARKHPELKVSGCSARHARLQPKFAFIKKIIDSGKLGKIYLVHHRSLSRQGRGGIEYHPAAKWFLDRSKSGGGPLYDWGVYDMSFHLGLLGEPELLKLDAFCVNGLDKVAHGAPVFTVEEHGGAFMTFAGGIKYWWERASNVHTEEPNRTTILGTTGGLRFGYCSWDPATVEYFDVADAGTGKARVEKLEVDMSSHKDGDMAPLGKAFIDFLAGVGPAPMTFELEIKNLDILHKVYQAANW
jgi:predicted dehydrogenase